TDYRTCLVTLFNDEVPYHPRVLSRSANIPAEYVARFESDSYPRAAIAALLDKGERIEVGELGFAAYYPPSHYHLLDETLPDRGKADVERPAPEGDARPWHEGDELFVPIRTHGGELLGLISLDGTRTGRAPDRKSVLPAVAFARQVAQLVARRRDAERLAAQAEREQVVNRITRAVRQSLDTDEVFRTAVGELGQQLGVDRCVLFMLDREAGVARNLAEYVAPGQMPAGREYGIPLIAGLVEGIRAHGHLVFEDVANDPAIRGVYENILSRLGTRSIMYVGIRVGSEMPAAFAVSVARERRRWRDSDVALARAVADQTGIAIRQAELYQRAEAAAARQALINRLSHAIRATLNLPEVMHTATHELGQALSASRVYIRPYDPARPDYSPAMYEYVAPGCRGVGAYGISYARPIGLFLKTQLKTLVVNDARHHDDPSPELNEHLRELAERVRTRSMLFCPLVVQGRFRGSLVIHQTDRVRRWERDEIALVESVAAQLATGVAQAELFEMVARAKRTWEVTFDAMSDGIFIFSNDRRLVRVNRAGAAMEAAAPRELIGRNCCDILRAGRGEGCVVERVAAEGRAVTLEYMPERLNQTLLVTAEPLVETAGHVGTVCTVRDLSEMRRIESLARERQSLLENVLESARETIAALSPEGRIMWCNKAATALGGYPMEELIGRSVFELVEESEVEPMRENIRRVLAGEALTVEVLFRTRAGEVRCAVSDYAPLVIEGRVTGVLTISRDITEQKRERERAAQADKLRALGQLASGVAHDFNNALAAILGRAQLLRRTSRDPAVARGLDIIQTAAEDAAATVRRIRAFAQQSPQGVGLAPLDLRELLRDAVEITRTRWENDARARGLSYDVRLDCDGAAHTRGDASELREVFVNLIVNAIDAMPAGGRLSITCRRAGARLRLDFKDTGDGMSEEVRARIFEPFYTTKGVTGTGLGLFVSYGIVERHGGHLTVSSERGRGTTFTLDLPHDEPAAEPRDPSRARADDEAAAPLSVLVVDDEPFVRETLAEMVETLGHDAALAGGGSAALRMLEERAFDFVFTDLSMPEMDGWELAREIRRRWPSLGVCIVTGYGKDADGPHDREADNEAFAVIGKPFNFDQVEETLARFKN
ncbi:MAG TPA: GAF domain-containing protein, partial [Pyrinomonadaceae bacterium]|nr:GAF domain-containing protein [Pyrinomonadaceae bacterium]